MSILNAITLILVVGVALLCGVVTWYGLFTTGTKTNKFITDGSLISSAVWILGSAVGFGGVVLATSAVVTIVFGMVQAKQFWVFLPIPLWLGYQVYRGVLKYQKSKD